MSRDDKETSIEAEIENNEEKKEESESDSNDSEESEVEKLKAEVAKWEDKFLRAHASFENSKRLLAKDKAAAVAYANESFARDILSVIDSLDSALSMIDNVDEKDANEFLKKMKEGLTLVDEQLHKVLEKNHIKNIECDKEYDPNLHQAIMQVDSDEHESGQIVQVMQKGYTIKDRVLRPAMVTTAK
jgi:molecular chaperone GrpE